MRKWAPNLRVRVERTASDLNWLLNAWCVERGGPQCAVSPDEFVWRPKLKHGSLATRPRWDWFLSRSRDFPARGEHESCRSRSQTLRTPQTTNGRARGTAARARRRRRSLADTQRRRRVRVHGLAEKAAAARTAATARRPAATPPYHRSRTAPAPPGP